MDDGTANDVDAAFPSRLFRSPPISMQRSYQRQTHGLEVPVQRRIPLVPLPPAVAGTIPARQTGLRVLLRSLMIGQPRTDGSIHLEHGRYT